MRRRTVLAIVLLIVLGRSAIFLLVPESYFDSDQAIVGLMAKHLSEGRAFPVFLYGQTYMLGVEAWLAAPLFLLFGASVAMLKLPLLVMNGVVAAALVTTFEREVGLRPELAFVAALPFVLPSVGLSAVFMDASGGSLEPFLYVVLLWITRSRPLLCGLVFGVGFVNREFTVYGLAALACLEAGGATLRQAQGRPGQSRGAMGEARELRELAVRGAKVVGVAASVWVGAQGLKHLSSAAGPGTSVADTFTSSNNLSELVARTCISPATALAGSGSLLRVHWPAILGTAPTPLSMFSIESRVSQGFAGTSWLPLAVAALSVLGAALSRGSNKGQTGVRPVSDPCLTPSGRFPGYLMLTGGFSVAGYLLGRCGEVTFYSMRYELLSVLALCGVSAWFLSRPAPRVLRGAWGVAFAAWMTVIAVPHVRFVAEYATHPPVPAKHALIRALQEKNVRYGRADYWLAYYIDFLTKERMIFAATAPQRILLYNKLVAEHADEAVTLSRRPCAGGDQLIPGVYACR